MILAFFVTGCAVPRYLPSSSDIGINQYGSYIQIFKNGIVVTDGELIAIDSTKIIVLSETTKKCVFHPIKNQMKFELKYAKPVHRGWTIPASTLFGLTHGFYGAFTVPINLIVTISVTSGGEKAFTYSDKNMTFEKLRMFARFPQGVTANIDLATLK